MKSRTWTLVAAVGLSLMLGGCKSDCRVVCERSQECFTSGLDVDSCTDNCQDKSDDNKDHADKAQECADCVSARVCSEVIKSCIDDCFGV
ncbi:hypothetical protein [Vitiosangium sp. GDMCC 1.1324]|uniref:hypothetical protein n=1 Tax=Vitiosangium sp. (strain GDMCC 1.1324) TaxID=2138576 RepID=UPI0011B548F4|nr:hypothetical protein [Vitiosangium sp. GDMCC 1.1324]